MAVEPSKRSSAPAAFSSKGSSRAFKSPINRKSATGVYSAYFMSKRLISAVLTLILPAFALLAQTEKRNGGTVHILHAVRASGKITIDGVLDDSVWLKAPMESDFKQRDPEEGKDPSEDGDPDRVRRCRDLFRRSSS